MQDEKKSDAERYPLLSRINSSADLKAMAQEDLKPLAEEIRSFLVERVTQNGGHLASNLGVVELSLAIHRVFTTPQDHIIFDVGHQGYVHKLITGRRDDFETLRRHLEHMLTVCGEKHVCLGGDLDGCEVLPEGFVNVASYADFYRYLQGCGYGEALLDDIFYGNMARLIEGGR